MRHIPTLLLSTAFLLSLATSGSAFSIQDDPLMYTVGSGGNQISGEINFLTLTTTHLEMNTQVFSGNLSGLTVLVCEDASCSNIREPTETGWTQGMGVDVTSHFIASNEAAFTFENFNTNAGGKGGQGEGGGDGDTSDPFFVNYEADDNQLAAGDFIWFTLLGKKNKPFGTAHTEIVPEPALAAVLLLGGGLTAAQAGRRLRQARG